LVIKKLSCLQKGILRRSKKKQNPKGFWLDRENRQNFFCELADGLNFDPHVPDNWTNITTDDVRSKKVLFPNLVKTLKPIFVQFLRVVNHY